MADIIQLTDYLNEFLDVGRFHDYAPNGLQVEGRREVRKIVGGVTASLALLERAACADADAILVHHGYFWRGEPQVVVGMKRQRLKFLLARDINLLGYHLPLDAHTECGNNAQLGRKLGLAVTGWFGEQGLIARGEMEKPMRLDEFGAHLERVLTREPLVVGEPTRMVQSVAWCSGGAQGYFDEAISQGVDVFITGEASEQNYHMARETGVAFIAAGHHATERYGVQALGAHLVQRFGVEFEFVDVENPV